MPWPEATLPPYLNIVGEDPQLTDPANGDFRPIPGSPAAGYGCQTFPERGGASVWDHVAASLFGAAAPSDGVVTPRLRVRSSIEASGPIPVDTVWDADTVRVVGSVTVEDGATLTITQGVIVEFADFYDLTVLGRMLAVGTADERIVFTTDEPGQFAVDSTAVGCWNGIRFPWTPSANAESRLEYCVIEYSKALGDEPCGGALSVVDFSKLLVRDCIFRNNVATYGGAVFLSHQAAPVLAGNLMEDNWAFVAGSAVYDLYSYPDITNCTIVANEVLNDEPFDATGAVHNHISKPRTTSSIVRDNMCAYFIPTQLLEAKAYYTTYCNLEGGHKGVGNIDEDPLFVGFGDHPYALAAGSPCIEGGAPDTLGLRLPAADLAGQVRIDGGKIDMGSYEGPGWTHVDDAPARALSVAGRPNPFRAGTTVSFALPVPARLTVRVYDVAGRAVRTLLDSWAEPGEYEVSWDGTDEEGRGLASGVYFLRVRTDSGEITEAKLVLLR